MKPYAPYPLNLLQDWIERHQWQSRLALALVLIPWFGHFAYTRITTGPVRPRDDSCANDAVRPSDPAVDRTADLVAAFKSVPIPAALPYPTTAPAGYAWVGAYEYRSAEPGRKIRAISPNGCTFSLSPTTALVGEWTPQRRHHLAEIVAWLEEPETRAALDRIVELSDKPFCVPDKVSQSDRSGPDWIREAACTLRARARYWMAERNDFDRALRDLDASLNLAAGIEDDGLLMHLYVGSNCRRELFGELLCWSREFSFTRAQARSLQDMLVRHRRDLAALWEATVLGERQRGQAEVDRLFARRGERGWMVLYDIRSDNGRHKASGLLNLLSPLFDDRDAACDCVRRFWDEQDREMKRLQHRRPTFAKRESSHACCDPLDGKPTLPFLPGQTRQLAEKLCLSDLYHNTLTGGVIAAMHLAAYRQDHGHYPAALSLLVPDYLEQLPADPFSDQPLRYRLISQGDYVLYSVSTDGRDDRGRRDRGPEGTRDTVLENTREQAGSDEFILVPAAQTRPSRP